jgi:hypothetical protein
VRAASGSRCVVGVPTKCATSWACGTFFALLFFCCLLALESSAAAATIGINFYGDTNGRKIGTKEAGVEPQVNWNDVGWWMFTNLFDNTGTTTAVSVTTNNTGTFAYNADVKVDPPSGGNDYLMCGYLYPSGVPLTVTIAGLEPPFTTHGYDVIVYFDGPNGGKNDGDWLTRYTVSANGNTVATVYGKDAKNAGWSGIFIPAFGTSTNDATAGNYVRFRGLTASSFTLVGTPLSGQGPINGLQIIACPEPVSLALVGVGLAATLVARRRSPAGG